MAGWSVPEDDTCSFDVLYILRRLQSIGFCADLFEGSRFEHILSVFLKEINSKKKILPFPAMLGDGRPVDLHKLYCVVSEKGGYDSVTVRKAWPMVAEAIGLGSSLGCPLKLIYAKYLDALEHCLQRFPAKKVVEDAHQGSVENLGLSPNDLEMDAGGFLKKILKMKKESVADTMPLCSKRDHFLTAASENERMLLSSNVECDKLADFGKNSETRGFSSLKRKRDALVGMLSWVKSAARNPIDPSVGKTSPQEVLKGADNLINEQYSHALQARKALFLKKIRRADIDRSPFQKAEKMNSSINGDVVCSSLQSSRCNQHSHSLEKTCNSCCSKMFIDGVQEKDENHTAVRSEALHEKRKLRIFVLFPDYLTDCIPNRIPLGPSFQAKVPTWLGEQPVDDSDDLKWLGSCIWPYQDHEKSSSTKHDAIGKGREEHCGCRNPGSLKCVRFHVAEKRLQLKRELGPVFYAWRFQCMGEEVALSWKEEEERKFEETVRLNTPSNSRNLWKQLHLLFPSKGNRGLVSYYFNVFLLARRSYQNRVTPEHIDSDDEENEVDFLSRPFGCDGTRFHDPRLMVCAQNKQCIDIEN